MEFEYSLHFGPVAARREALVLEIERLMRRLGAWPEGELHRLAFVENEEGAGGRFAFVDEVLKGQDLEEVLEQSRAWDGVYLGLSYELSRSGLWLLGNEEETGVVLRMPAGPMYARRNHPWHAGRMFELVADTTEDLGADFALFEGAWPGRGRTLADVDMWLDMLEAGEPTGWEWVLMREGGMAFEEVGEEIEEFERAEYALERFSYRHMWLASRWPHFRPAPM